MENTNNYDLMSFMTAKFFLKDLYGITMSDEDFIEKGMMVLNNDIKTYNTSLFKYKILVPKDKIVEVPSEKILSLKAVSTDEAIIDGLGGANVVIDLTNSLSFDLERGTNDEHYAKNFKESKTALIGDYVTYEMVDTNKLKINDSLLINTYVYVLYEAQLEDDDNLPLLTEAQVQAIAARIAYMEGVKRAYMGNPIDPNIFQMIMIESTRLISAAKRSQIFTDNQLDKLMDAQVSFNRKSFGHPINLTR